MQTRQALHELCPHDHFPPLNKIRLGSPHDGGYVVVDNSNFSGQTVLSFGIGDNLDLEMDLINRGAAVVYAYDHTIDQLPCTHPRLHWHKQSIHNWSSGVGVSLEQIVDAYNLRQNNNIFLKCDIEDSEWDLIEQTSENIWSLFSQMVIEFHFLDRMTDQERLNRMHHCWSKLAQSHACVHVHANTWGSFDFINQLPIPQVIEVTYLRRDICKLVPSFQLFPTSLDRTNCPHKEDYWLGSFRFLS